MAEKGDIDTALNLLKKDTPELYLKQGKKIENRLIDIYKTEKPKKIFDEFFLSRKEYMGEISQLHHIKKRGENPVLALIGGSGTGKTNFLISFFEEIYDCQVLILKTYDGLRHAQFFKGKNYALIYDDFEWSNENTTREKMLELLSGETTSVSNIKHSSVLVPTNTCRALTSNYSLNETDVVKKSKNEITCFNRRIHEIELNSALYKKKKNTINALGLKEVKKLIQKS